MGVPIHVDCSVNRVVYLVKLACHPYQDKPCKDLLGPIDPYRMTDNPNAIIVELLMAT
jgi:hypothetical protein